MDPGRWLPEPDPLLPLASALMQTDFWSPAATANCGVHIYVLQETHQEETVEV